MQSHLHLVLALLAGSAISQTITKDPGEHVPGPTITTAPTQIVGQPRDIRIGDNIDSALESVSSRVKSRLDDNGIQIGSDDDHSSTTTDSTTSTTRDGITVDFGNAAPIATRGLMDVGAVAAVGVLGAAALI